MAEETLKIACIGECMVEFSPTKSGDYQRNFAGDTFNTAVYLKRQFGERLAVYYVSALGCDTASSAIVAQMEVEGVDSQLVQRIEGGRPGLYMIENDAGGERFFSYWRSTSAARSMFKGMDEHQIYDRLAGFDLIYLSGITLAILDQEQRRCLLLALGKLKEKKTIAFDPNYRAALWDNVDVCADAFRQIAAVTSVVLATYDDDLAIWGDASIDKAAQRWMSWGATEVVVKDGAQGCTVFNEKGQWKVPTPRKIIAVDTTGAGDSFAAGYLGARLLGSEEKQAAMMAHQLAGQVIAHAGGVIAAENWRTVEEINSHI